MAKGFFSKLLGLKRDPQYKRHFWLHFLYNKLIYSYLYNKKTVNRRLKFLHEEQRKRPAKSLKK
jgi:hypothetical protein